jgi:hypothetical protein
MLIPRHAPAGPERCVNPLGLHSFTLAAIAMPIWKREREEEGDDKKRGRYGEGSGRANPNL